MSVTVCKPHVVERRRFRARPAGTLDGSLVLAQEEQAVDLEGQRPAQPTPVTDALGERLRPVEMAEGSLVLSQ